MSTAADALRGLPYAEHYHRCRFEEIRRQQYEAGDKDRVPLKWEQVRDSDTFGEVTKKEMEEYRHLNELLESGEDVTAYGFKPFESPYDFEDVRHVYK